MKRLYELFLGTRSHGLVSIQFLAALNLSLGRKEQISKDALTKIYHNLSLQALCKKENVEVNFEKVMDLATEINLRLKNLILANKSNAQKLKFENKKKEKRKI